MHVALYTDSNVFAGTERHILELGRALKDEGIEVSIACPSDSPLTKAEMQFGKIVIEKRGLLDVWAILKLRKMLLDRDIDVIHAHNGRTALAAAAAGWLAGKGTIVATQHFIEPAHASRTGLRARFSRAAHRWVQRRTHRFIAVSRAAEKAMITRECGLAGKVSVIPNGISAPGAGSLIPAREVRRELGIANDAQLIVCVARLQREKDIPTLIAAMEPITAQFPGCRCVIAGDGEERARLEEQIRAAAWGRQIILTGFRKDALSVINAADLFVLPSRAEPFGLVLLEAMALGKPVVSTAAGGPLEIVQNGKTGLLVPPGDSAALADAIAQLLRYSGAKALDGRPWEGAFPTGFYIACNGLRHVERLPMCHAAAASGDAGYGGGKMRVLLIAQQCQVRDEGQPKARQLAEFPDIELKVLVPDRYYVEGRTLRRADPPESPTYSYQIGKVCWPWTGPGQWYLHWYPRLAALLKSFRPDIIDLWEEPWGLVSVEACVLRNLLLPETRIISETEQNVDKRLPFPFEAFRRFTLRNADFVIGRNAEAVEIARRKGSHSPSAVVPNGVDTGIFKPIDREAARRALDFSGFVCGFVGRLVEQKGLEEIVRALKECPPDVNLVFAGAGPFQATLERLVRELDQQSRVRFLPNRGREELPEVMSALDVLLLPSRTTPRWKEQFGRVIIEAHACRTPVIGSDSGAIPDVIRKGGLIVPERDPIALAAAICKMRENPRLREEMGSAGLRQVNETYSWHRVAAQMRDIYVRLPARNRLAAPRLSMSEAAR